MSSAIIEKTCESRKKATMTMLTDGMEERNHRKGRQEERGGKPLEIQTARG
jgi:hypothetical protein